MQRSVRGFLIIATSMAAVVTVQSTELRVQRQPIVVHDGPSTVMAQRYYRRLQGRSQVQEPVVTPSGAGVVALQERLPLKPQQLRVGSPDLRVQEGLVTPLFLMGMDRVSLAWFDRAAQGLSDVGARGVVVEASDTNDWRSLQQHASDLGIPLMLLDGDAMAEGYQVSTYPVVFVSPALAREYLRE